MSPASPRTKKLLKFAVSAGFLGFVAFQVFPAKTIGVHTEDIGTNPPERFTIDAPPEVLAVIKRACWDCHTNETEWPLYARIAPGSWLMARDVHNGRNHLNFSKWADSDEDERETDRENCWDQVEQGNMPPWFYLPLHPHARLSDADKAVLKGWFMKDAKPKNADKKDEAKGDTKEPPKDDTKK